MLALKITDIKDFMSKLLGSTIFDAFYLVEASITTFQTYTIDGTLRKNFYEEEQLSSLFSAGQAYSRWKDSKALCFSMIKGNRTPLRFKFIFQQSVENTEKVLKRSGASLTSSDVNGLYLNFQYNGEELLCTTGTSLRVFTLDKSLDTTWDSLVLSFFQKQNIVFQKET